MPSRRPAISPRVGRWRTRPRWGSGGRGDRVEFSRTADAGRPGPRPRSGPARRRADPEGKADLLRPGVERGRPHAPARAGRGARSRRGAPGEICGLPEGGRPRRDGGARGGRRLRTRRPRIRPRACARGLRPPARGRVRRRALRAAATPFRMGAGAPRGGIPGGLGRDGGDPPRRGRTAAPGKGRERLEPPRGGRAGGCDLPEQGLLRRPGGGRAPADLRAGQSPPRRLPIPRRAGSRGDGVPEPGEAGPRARASLSAVASPRLGAIGLGLVFRDVPEGGTLADPARPERRAVVVPLPFA